jgi:hypothetical protein
MWATTPAARILATHWSYIRQRARSNRVLSLDVAVPTQGVVETLL